MPVSGFKKGDRVLTPGGYTGTVARVTRRGAENVVVKYDHPVLVGEVERTFRAAALRRIEGKP